MDLNGVDFDEILESEMSADVDDDSDLISDNPNLPENLLATHSIRYEYLSAITGQSISATPVGSKSILCAQVPLWPRTHHMFKGSFRARVCTCGPSLNPGT